MRSARWLIFLAAAAAAAFLLSGCSAAKPEAAPSHDPKAPVAPAHELVAWVGSYEEAAAQAKQEGKPVMVDVMASWCNVCKKLDAQVWTREDVAEVSRQFVAAKVDGDERPDLKSRLNVSGYPTTLFLTADGKELGRVRGLVPPAEMIEAMRDALKQSS